MLMKRRQPTVAIDSVIDTVDCVNQYRCRKWFYETTCGASLSKSGGHGTRTHNRLPGT